MRDSLKQALQALEQSGCKAAGYRPRTKPQCCDATSTPPLATGLVDEPTNAYRALISNR